VNDLPIWLLATLVIGGFVVGSAVALLAVRRWVLPRLDVEPDDSEFGGAMVQAILVFYALAVALVAVGTWESHTAIADQSSDEAATIAALYRQALLLPDEVRDDLRDELTAYTSYIIDEAWPAQARGEIPEDGTDYLTAIQDTLGGFDPPTAGLQNIHAEALADFNDLVELRRLRLDAVGTHLSGAMWIFVLGGALLAIASTFFFVVADRRLHLILVCLLAAFIGMVVVIISAYDRPFVGDLRVTPAAYELLLDTVSGAG
jgi:ABC-type multidrug transport system fused ATPase/permease subunit